MEAIETNKRLNKILSTLVANIYGSGLDQNLFSDSINTSDFKSEKLGEMTNSDGNLKQEIYYVSSADYDIDAVGIRAGYRDDYTGVYSFNGLEIYFQRVGAFFWGLEDIFNVDEVIKTKVEEVLSNLKLQHSVGSRGETLITNTEGKNLVLSSSITLFAEIVPEGKSYINLKKDHNCWVFSENKERFISFDKQLIQSLRKHDKYRDENGWSENGYTYIHSCPECGDKVYGRTRKGERVLCPKCSSRVYVCDECGKPYVPTDRENDEGLCPSCKNAPRCKGCGNRITKGNESDQGYAHLCYDCSDINGRQAYHTNRGRQDESEGSRFKLGVEVEKEDGVVLCDMDVAKLLNDTGWIIERDGSLSEDYGFEAISPIYPLDPIKFKEKVYGTDIMDIISAKISDRCGGHLHVSDSEKTPYELLADIKGYLPLLYGLYPSRAENTYCKAKDIPGYLDREHDGHRQAINPNDRTLEFRIFPAIKDLAQLLFRIELVKYIVEHPYKDIIPVAEMLLDKNSDLHKIINKRVSEKNILNKAEIMMNYNFYYEHDPVSIVNGVPQRLMKPNPFKILKDEDTQKTIEDMSNRVRECNRPVVGRRSNNFLSKRLNDHFYGWYGKGLDLLLQRPRAFSSESLLSDIISEGARPYVTSHAHIPRQGLEQWTYATPGTFVSAVGTDVLCATDTGDYEDEEVF